MSKVILSIILVLLVIYIVPIIVYGLLSSVWGLKTPGNSSPMLFLVSVLVTKIGMAIAFVLIYYFARSSMSSQFLLYAFLWWIMFVVGEVGQTIVPGYSWKEAVAGIISETIYLPISALIVNALLKS